MTSNGYAQISYVDIIDHLAAGLMFRFMMLARTATMCCCMCMCLCCQPAEALGARI